jgi:ribosome biogenesis GTPase / thiamine phosphate phosphatase
MPLLQNRFFIFAGYMGGFMASFEVMTLHDLGWNDTFAKEFAPYHLQGWKPGRLIRDNRITFGALLENGVEREVVLSGKVYHQAETDADLPAVGDWVALEVGAEGEETMIRARLKRQSCLSRRAAGLSAEEQVIVTNIDVVVVVTDAGPDFNPRRLERYFAVIGRSGAKAVVLLNKADLFTEAQNQEAAATVATLNPAADIHITCLENKTGQKAVRRYLQPGVTVALMGSSGVGKSAMVNQLLGDEWQWTDEVNEVTGKGRHTTTARELLVLPTGGMIIDNPGIKEVQMWTDEASLRERFADLEILAGQCKYHDCRHGVTNAGCAIRAAIADGGLDLARLEGFLKLEAEIEKLRGMRKKRQMTVDRRNRREQKANARNRSEKKESTYSKGEISAF